MRWTMDWRAQALTLLALCCLMLLLQCSISWGLLCLCEVLLCRSMPKKRWVCVDTALVGLPCLVFISYLVFGIAQGIPGISGDLLSDMFFMVAAVVIRICQHYRPAHPDASDSDQAPAPGAKGFRLCGRCCCGGCAVILTISLLAQSVGMLVFLGQSPRPAYTRTAIAYWCKGEPNNSLVVLEPGYLASPGTLYFVQEAPKPLNPSTP